MFTKFIVAVDFQFLFVKGNAKDPRYTYIYVIYRHCVTTIKCKVKMKVFIATE